MQVQNPGYCILLFWVLLLFCPASIKAQQRDTLKGRNLYHPIYPGTDDTVIRPLQNLEQANGALDSIRFRNVYARDSLMAREGFVKDSIRHHQGMLDSLTFLQQELQWLLNAYIRTVKEDIILQADRITINGDSALGDYIYTILPFGTIEPYRPWEARIRLSDRSTKIITDRKLRRITFMVAPYVKCSFRYQDNILVISERAMVMKHWSEKFYTMPFDSVFLDKDKRVVKIKKYSLYYTVVNENQKGTPLFSDLTMEMQYQYDKDNLITKYQITKFCERWKASDLKKVCSIITYSITKQEDFYLVNRHNVPENKYSDGTYTFEFDGNSDLRSISFHNLSGTEDWQRAIELNKDGNVGCYMDKTRNVIRKSLCMIYHQDEPGAKFPVETITTTFEDDGISYYQINNTTGKSRTRDRMTLEWSPWR